jgi:hypothetical protein
MIEKQPSSVPKNFVNHEILKLSTAVTASKPSTGVVNNPGMYDVQHTA